MFFCALVIKCECIFFRSIASASLSLVGDNSLKYKLRFIIASELNLNTTYRDNIQH